MTTSHRGITNHLMVESFERVHLRLIKLRFSEADATRGAGVLTAYFSGDHTREQAWEAGDAIAAVTANHTKPLTGATTMHDDSGTVYPQLFTALATLFKPTEIKTRPQGGRQVQYITARTVMNRLDDILGPENWWDEYQPLEHSVICRLTIRLPDGSTLTKCDAGGYAGMTDQGDDEKSGYSDSFKRAAVKFGVGRHLYGDGVATFKAASAPAKPAPTQTPTHHDNGNPPGTGSRAAEIVTAYQGFLAASVRDINQKWVDRITDKKTGEKLSADGEIVTATELSKHLSNWARSMDWLKAPVDMKADQRDRFVAIAWESHMAEFTEETRRCFHTLWNQALKKIKVPKAPAKQDGDANDLASQDEVLDLMTTEAGARG